MNYLRIYTKDDATKYVDEYKGKLPPIQLMGKRCDGFFYKNSKLISVEEIKSDTAVDLFRLFYGCRSLTKLPSKIELPTVVSMDYCFGECTSLNQEFEIITPSLRSARGTFKNCTKLRLSPKFTITGSGLRDISEIFYGCTWMKDISGIDYSNVVNMSRSFQGCIRLKLIPENFSTSNCKLMNDTFYGCSSLTKLPNFDTSNVLLMEYLFSECSKLKELPELNTSNCTSIWGMCFLCRELTKVPKLDFSKLGSKLYTFDNLVNYVFGGCLDPLKLAKLCLGDLYAEFSKRNNKISNFSGRMYNLCSRLSRLRGDTWL